MEMEKKEKKKTGCSKGCFLVGVVVIGLIVFIFNSAVIIHAISGAKNEAGGNVAGGNVAGGNVAGGNVAGVVTPAHYFEAQVLGDIRQGKSIRLTGFSEDEDVWTKYKGVVMVPRYIDGLEVTNCMLEIFNDPKFLNELLIPDASVLNGSGRMLGSIYLNNGFVTSIIIMGTPKSSFYFSCPKLKTLTMEAVGQKGKMPNISNTSIEEFVVPKDCKKIIIEYLPITLKKLKCPKRITFTSHILEIESQDIKEVLKKAVWRKHEFGRTTEEVISHLEKTLEIEYYEPETSGPIEDRTDGTGDL